MKGIRRVYYRAATERRAKAELRSALTKLENNCLPPRRAATGTDDFQRAMLNMTFWPSADVLIAMDSSVETLAMLEREKVPKPLWKAFKLVNQRWPGYSTSTGKRSGAPKAASQRQDFTLKKRDIS